MKTAERKLRFDRAVKSEFNKPIYQRVLAMVNNGATLETVEGYVGMFYNAESRASAVARLFAPARFFSTAEGK